MSETKPEHICPTHLTKLGHLLKGSVGYCGKCGLYVQSANHPLVELDPHIAEKRAQTAQSKGRRKRAAKAAQPTTGAHAPRLTRWNDGYCKRERR